MNFPESSSKDAIKRLSRAEGQVRAVQRMLEDGCDCRDIITQLTASIKALEQAGVRLVSSGLAECISKESSVDEDLVAEMEKLFLRIR
ncbi:MAG: metal-sensitive transcriptional regulator [Acidimicrobiales bacterium]|nr:metal-sensitive transcriptional regulator [Acidimicrobiales bacterium]